MRDGVECLCWLHRFRFKPRLCLFRFTSASFEDGPMKGFSEGLNTMVSVVYQCVQTVGRPCLRGMDHVD